MENGCFAGCERASRDRSSSPWSRYVADVALPRAFRVRDADARALALNDVAPAACGAVAGRFVAESGLVARQLALGRLAPLKPIRCPVLVVSATDDRLIPVAVHRRIAARYRADHVPVLGRGHMLPIEANWRGPASRILDWIDQRSVRVAAGPLASPVYKLNRSRTTLRVGRRNRFRHRGRHNVVICASHAPRSEPNSTSIR
jgi:hypothetical protein